MYICHSRLIFYHFDYIFCFSFICIAPIHNKSHLKAVWIQDRSNTVQSNTTHFPSVLFQFSPVLCNSDQSVHFKRAKVLIMSLYKSSTTDCVWSSLCFNPKSWTSTKKTNRAKKKRKEKDFNRTRIMKDDRRTKDGQKNQTELKKKKRKRLQQNQDHEGRSKDGQKNQTELKKKKQLQQNQDHGGRSSTSTGSFQRHLNRRVKISSCFKAKKTPKTLNYSKTIKHRRDT